MRTMASTKIRIAVLLIVLLVSMRQGQCFLPMHAISNNYKKCHQRNHLYASQVSIQNFNRGVSSDLKQILQETQSTSGSASQQELLELKSRIDKLEKTLLQKQLTAAKSKGTVESLMEEITPVSLEMTARTVEICSVIAFAGIGSVIGSSLLDRLWLLGGIMAAWWSSGAVHRDTRGGALARWAGVLLAQSVREVQEKVYQFRIFYKTGKLAYMSSKVWEQYDNKYSIMKRLNLTKQQIMVSAASFRNMLDDQSYASKAQNVYEAILKIPDELVKYDEKYGVRARAANRLGELWEDTADLTADLLESSKSTPFFDRFGSSRRNRLRRGRLIDPWAPVWTSFRKSKTSRWRRLLSP